MLDEFFDFAQSDIESGVDLGSCGGVAGLKQQILHCLSNVSADAAASAGNFEAAIYWASGEAFSEEQKSAHRSSGQGREVLTFNLPEPVRADMRLRFDPSDQETGSKTVTVKLDSMLLFGAQDASGVDLMPALKRVGVDDCKQCELKPSDDGVSLIIRGNDPWVVIDLASLGLPSHLRLERVEAHLDWGS